MTNRSDHSSMRAVVDGATCTVTFLARLFFSRAFFYLTLKTGHFPALIAASEAAYKTPAGGDLVKTNALTLVYRP